ncbi:ArnT family glycosyltransferase [Dyadobacter psychrophilus]|uniref:ArnT family glycosyltransferase n=1 Tax=Dyadobacter psychrophilus TaxID=651661 RepID=UPI0014839D32|nr:glycosyltransferase family 39 protein [Dyadobacter psychrophilus]
MKKITTWGLVASLVVIFLGWSIDIPEHDIAEYMQSKGLFKPSVPIIYRLVDFSTLLFGKNNFGYRLPSFFFTLVTLHTLYRFALLSFNRDVALLTILIFATLQATFLINLTALPETSLMAFYSAAIWQLTKYYKERRVVNLTEGIAAALLAAVSRNTLPEMAADYNPFHMITDLGWGFFPWGLFLLLGVIDKVRDPRSGTVPFIAQISFYAFLFTLLLLSLNPYYSHFDVVILCPMGALVAGEYIYKKFYSVKDAKPEWLYKVSIALWFILIGLLFAIVWFPFPEANYYGMIHFMALLSAFTWLIFFSSIGNKLIIAGTVLSVGTNLVLNTYFFPNLLNYQAGSKLGRIAADNGGIDYKLHSFKAEPSSSLAFYAGVPVIYDMSFKQLVSQKNCWIYTSHEMLDEFKAARPDLQVIASNPNFQFEKLNLHFLDPASRPKMTSSKILIKL